MAKESKTPYGNINISDQAIAELVAEAASTCYGVVEITVPEGYIQPRKKAGEEGNEPNAYKGVIVKKIKEGYEINLYIIAAYGVKITEVVQAVQKRVAYTLNKTFNMPFKKVNVFVRDIKEIK